MATQQLICRECAVACATSEGTCAVSPCHTAMHRRPATTAATKGMLARRCAFICDIDMISCSCMQADLSQQCCSILHCGMASHEASCELTRASSAVECGSLCACSASKQPLMRLATSASLGTGHATAMAADPRMPARTMARAAGIRIHRISNNVTSSSNGTSAAPLAMAGYRLVT